MLFEHKKPKRIVQLLPSFVENDAVSNQAMVIDQILREAGYKTGIYTNHFPKKYKRKIGEAKFLNDSDFDLAIYHHSIGDPIVDIVKSLKIPVILYYHNITPPSYFEKYSGRIHELLSLGLLQLDELVDKPIMALGVSEFNRLELEKRGFENTGILPILFDEQNLEKLGTNKAKQDFLDRDNIVNFLFVGRFVPNKSHKDLIKAFYIYHKYYNSISRLCLVGSPIEMDNYLEEVKELIHALELDEVVDISGMVSREEWKSYYQNSHLFLSMSEHEGFFVPALEAQYFGLPVLAYNAGAVADTVGEGGIVIDTKNPEVIAELMQKIVSDNSLREELIEKGRENIARFDYERTRERLLGYLQGAG
jgi:L-malate glycosyltransferase